MRKLFWTMAVLGVMVAPASAEVLISDDFSSADNANINVGVARQTGSLAGTSYFYDASAGNVTLVSGQVQMGEITSVTGETFLSLDHNFVDSAITTNGGFILKYDSDPVGSKWLAGSIGLDAAEADSASRHFLNPEADMGWMLRDNLLRVEDSGDTAIQFDLTGDGAYSVEVRVETISFASGAAATFFISVDGTEYDLNGAGTAGNGWDFTWDADNENYMHFANEVNSSNVAGTFDNFSVETIPEPATMGLLALGGLGLLLKRRRRIA